MEELVGIVVAATVILLLAFLFIIFQRLRLSRRRNRPLSLNIDSNGKELVPLNSTRNGDLPDFKRSSKMSNLEMTQVIFFDAMHALDLSFSSKRAVSNCSASDLIHAVIAVVCFVFIHFWRNRMFSFRLWNAVINYLR